MLSWLQGRGISWSPYNACSLLLTGQLCFSLSELQEDKSLLFALLFVCLLVYLFIYSNCRSTSGLDCLCETTNLLTSVSCPDLFLLCLSLLLQNHFSWSHSNTQNQRADLLWLIWIVIYGYHKVEAKLQEHSSCSKSYIV